MKKRRWTIPAFLIAAFLAFSAIFIGCPAVTLANMDGTWTGSWDETLVPPASGAMTVVISVSGDTVTATGDIDLSDLGDGVEAGTATGSISGGTLSFSFDCAGVNGTGNGTIVGNIVTGSGSIYAGAWDFTFTATVSGSTITGTYEFTAGGSGAGDVTMTRS